MKEVNTLDAYQNGAKETAIYKERILYPCVGLVGEAGEVADKVKKVMRDSNGNATDEQKNGIILEEGDVMWYTAAILLDLNLNFGMIEDWIKRPSFQSKLSALIVLNQPLLAVRICKLSAVISDYVIDEYYYESKQQISTDGFLMSNIAELVACIDRLAKMNGYTLKSVCNKNLEKLEGRAKRDTLHGSGDER